jgi:hypothetical protein
MAPRFKDSDAGRRKMPAAPGVFIEGPGLNKPGYVTARPGRSHGGPGVTPALVGMFRAGRVVGVSQINAMATNVRRGP